MTYSLPVQADVIEGERGEVLQIGHGTLRLDHSQRSERPGGHLLLIVGKGLVGEVQGTLLYGHVGVSIYQVPVNVLDLRYRLDDL